MSLTAKGKPLTTQQQTNAARLIGIGTQLNAPAVAIQACLFDAIFESDLGLNNGWNSSNPTYGGILAGNVRYFGHLGNANSENVTNAEARSFYQGGNGYQAGGAIKGASQYPDPSLLGPQVTAPFDSNDPPPYGQYLKQGGLALIRQVKAEAISITSNVNGLSGGIVGTNPVSASLWYVGDEMNPDENYWTCINRYGQSAQWYVFSDGEALYVADGIKLMGQTPVDLIALFDPRVIEAHLTFDNCLMLDTPIPTPDGWTTMGEVQIGDSVLGSDGRPARVVGVSDTYRDHDCYRLTFSDGTSIVADDGHLWETISTRKVGHTMEMVSHQRYRGIRTTAEIAATQRDVSGQACHRIKIAESLDLPERDLPVDPYVLGYWLGDGTTGTPIITVSNEDVASLTCEIERAGYSHNTRQATSTGWSHGTFWRVSPRVSQASTVCATDGCKRTPAAARGLCGSCYSRQRRRGDLPAPTRTGFSKLLREVGVLRLKRIPSDYLRASKEQRLALLQGLMDSDGSITKFCDLTFADEGLAQDALELVRSLGFAPTWTEKPARGRSRPQFSVRFSTKSHLNAFRLPRKADRYAARLAEKANGGRTCRSIRSVERVPSVPVRCIQVDAEDHLYLAGEGMVPTHNTSFAYTHTSVKKGKTVRRATLARTTSPTECEIKIICPVDAYRGGEVVYIKQFGPAADGLWLIGEARRSVFEPYTTLTLVQGMAPINAVTGLPLGPAFLSGSAATKPGAGTVINAMVSEATTINNEHLPYVWGGGHAHTGVPSGVPVPGFDCSGAVASVLAAGGVWTQSSVPTSDGIVSDLLNQGGVLAAGYGHGKPEVTLFDTPNHIFMRINGEFFGTADGQGDVPSGSAGGGWIPNGGPGTGYRVTHVLPSVLGQQATASGA